MSALPPTADIRPRDQDVCFGPIGDINPPSSPAANTLIRGRKILVQSNGAIGSLCSGGSLLARLLVVSNRVSVPGDGSTRAGGLEVALRPALQKNGLARLERQGRARGRASNALHPTQEH
jgi:hypothetical protein